MLCYLGSAGGRMYGLELLCLYVCVAVGQAAVWPELPLYPVHVLVGPPHCPDRVVAGRPQYAREAWALALLNQTEVATFTSGNS